jgi:transposase
MVTLTREQITDWKSRGYTYKEMAEKSGLCVNTVCRYMDRYGLSGRRLVTEADRETFRRKAAEGMGTGEIASRYGFAYSTVYLVLKEAGLIRKEKERDGRIPEEEERTPLPRYTMAKKKKGAFPIDLWEGGRHYVMDVTYLYVPL